jgi:hypothetical protein
MQELHDGTWQRLPTRIGQGAIILPQASFVEP